MYIICVKRTLENTTTAGINYKELYDCKWDRMTLNNNIYYTTAFMFLKLFWPDDSLHRAKIVATIYINKVLGTYVYPSRYFIPFQYYS